MGRFNFFDFVTKLRSKHSSFSEGFVSWPTLRVLTLASWCEGTRRTRHGRISTHTEFRFDWDHRSLLKISRNFNGSPKRIKKKHRIRVPSTMFKLDEGNVDRWSYVCIFCIVLSWLEDWVCSTLNANKWAMSCALKCLSCFSACSWCHLGSVCNGHLQWQGPKEARAAHFLALD